jgi:hypothetical protein
MLEVNSSIGLLAKFVLRSLSMDSFDQYDWEHIISSPSSVVTLVVLAAMDRAWFRFRIRMGRSGKFADPYGTKVP